MELLHWSLFARAGEYDDEYPIGSSKESRNLSGHQMKVERSAPNALKGKPVHGDL